MAVPKRQSDHSTYSILADCGFPLHISLKQFFEHCPAFLPYTPIALFPYSPNTFHKIYLPRLVVV